MCSVAEALVLLLVLFTDNNNAVCVVIGVDVVIAVIVVVGGGGVSCGHSTRWPEWSPPGREAGAGRRGQQEVEGIPYHVNCT